MANLLQYETSPYLLQHAHNPVDWHPWGEAAFEKAKLENKPVLVSIGYATCHWCHVMERESFEDEHVAAVMNEKFVCIKVDREEHPDVDHMYMDALIAMQQGGGWPLNMFVTPDKQPFYGGTYFPPTRYHNRMSWTEVLDAISYTWHHKQEDIRLQAEQLITHLNQINQLPTAQIRDIQFKDLEQIKDKMLAVMDHDYGGFSFAPKFLATNSIQFLIDYAYFTHDKELFETAIFNLKQMLAGGIYDQLEGGISRYSTDNEWLVPHFEKMLYDNALLISVMSHTIMLQDNTYIKSKIKQTINWAETWLKDSETSYYKSAVDADSEGIEGKFYVWDYYEIKQLIPAQYMPFFEYYWGLSAEGNWEGVNILNETHNDKAILTKFGIESEEWYAIKFSVIKILLDYRNSRIKPIVDAKLIVSQNAMWADALFNAYKSLGDIEYKRRGINILQSIKTNCQGDPNYLKHIIGKPTIKANLDDYAWVIKASINCFSLTQDNNWLEWAQILLNYVLQYFDTESHTLLNYTHENQTDILVRKVETYDGATPSSNAIMVENLLFLGNAYYNFDWIERAQLMISQLHSQVIHYPTSYARFATFMQYKYYHLGVIKTNDNSGEILLKYYSPHVLFIYDALNKPNNDEKWYQFCNDGECEMPTNKGFELFDRKKITSFLF